MRVELLTNRTTAAERRRIAAGLDAGEVDILVGTHALLYGDAQFTRLGLAVIDEQHRFGVEQRALLRGKGDEPDVLVMTATPIPRTAAMLVYGDLDRRSCARCRPAARRSRRRSSVRARSTRPPRGNDCAPRSRPDTRRTSCARWSRTRARSKPRPRPRSTNGLQAEELKGLRVGLLHGQMKSKDKETVMAAFRAGELDVLVATTVIEVGVDVPNATVMIVEDADRFGLSQLHQLRGRVGRGADQSYCFLFADPTTPDGEERMEAMAASTDGFDLAEKDLEIRGAGEVFGERQSGISDLKLGRIPRDEPIVIETRRVAEDDPRRRPRARRGTPSCARKSKTSSATTSSSSSSHEGRRHETPARACA